MGPSERLEKLYQELADVEKEQHEVTYLRIISIPWFPSPLPLRVPFPLSIFVPPSPSPAPLPPCPFPLPSPC